MELKEIEQLKIINGEKGSPQPNEADLLSLVLQSAVMKVTMFVDTTKDVTGNATAQSYLSKVGNINSQILNENTSTIKRLRRLVISILSETGVNYTQIGKASDDDWMNFIYENMDEAIDYLAGVIPSERGAYDNI